MGDSCSKSRNRPPEPRHACNRQARNPAPGQHASVTGHNDLQIGSQVALEIKSADKIDLLCLRPVRRRAPDPPRAERVPSPGRSDGMIDACTQVHGARALDDLVGLGAKVKISFETSHTRLHAKAWLFERNTGFATAYVGSSNLTHSALVDGLEWNVRATQVDNAAIIQRIAATFEQYWNEPEFESYDPRTDGARLQLALDEQNSPRGGLDEWRPTLDIDVQPKPFQAEMLKLLGRSDNAGISAILWCRRRGLARLGCRRSITSDYERRASKGCSSLPIVMKSCVRAKRYSASF